MPGVAGECVTSLVYLSGSPPVEVMACLTACADSSPRPTCMEAQGAKLRGPGDVSWALRPQQPGLAHPNQLGLQGLLLRLAEILKLGSMCACSSHANLS